MEFPLKCKLCNRMITGNESCHFYDVDREIRCQTSYEAFIAKSLLVICKKCTPMIFDANAAAYTLFSIKKL